MLEILSFPPLQRVTDDVVLQCGKTRDWLNYFFRPIIIFAAWLKGLQVSSE